MPTVNENEKPPTIIGSVPGNINLIPNFVTNFLQNEQTSIYRGASWIVNFGGNQNGLKGLLSAIKKANEYEPHKWKMASEYVSEDTFQKTQGCLYAQAISIPGESFQPIPGGNISSNAFIRPYVGSGRNSFPFLRMSFLETVISFTDYFLRPWVVATETFGMLAPQTNDTNYRTTLECWKLGPYPKTGTNSPAITTKYTFYDVCCISVGDEEFNYSPINAPILRDAQFVYSSYAINSTDKPSTNADVSGMGGSIDTIKMPDNQSILDSATS